MRILTVIANQSADWCGNLTKIKDAYLNQIGVYIYQNRSSAKM